MVKYYYSNEEIPDPYEGKFAIKDALKICSSQVSFYHPACLTAICLTLDGSLSESEDPEAQERLRMEQLQNLVNEKLNTLDKPADLAPLHTVVWQREFACFGQTVPLSKKNRESSCTIHLGDYLCLHRQPSRAL